MKKFKIILILAVLCICVKENTVYAKVTKEKIANAKMAYSGYLVFLLEDAEERGYDVSELYIKFGLIDVNKDNIPELVYALYDSEHIHVCTYKNGNVIEVTSTGLGTTLKIYPNRKLIRMKGVHCGQFYDYYYKFDGREAVLLTEKVGDECINVITGEQKKNIKANTYSPYLYKINGNKVSKSKYQKYIKKITKGAKQEKIKLYDCNAENIEKYLR